MEKNRIYQMVQEEVSKMIKESKEKAPALDAELEKLRKKFESSMTTTESLGAEVVGPSRKQKRVQINTVAELLDVPVNELMLHFLNNVKTKNERSLVEYRQGHVVFYSE